MGTEEVEPTNINFAEKNEDVISLKNVKTIIEENIDSLIKKMGTGGLKHEGKKEEGGNNEIQILNNIINRITEINTLITTINNQNLYIKLEFCPDYTEDVNACNEDKETFYSTVFLSNNNDAAKKILADNDSDNTNYKQLNDSFIMQNIKSLKFFKEWLKIKKAFFTKLTELDNSFANPLSPYKLTEDDEDPIKQLNLNDATTKADIEGGINTSGYFYDYFVTRRGNLKKAVEKEMKKDIKQKKPFFDSYIFYKTLKKIKHNGEYQKLKWGEKRIEYRKENIVIEGNEEDKKYDIQLYFNDGEIKSEEAIIDIDEENAKRTQRRSKQRRKKNWKHK